MYKLKMLIKYRGTFRRLQQRETSILLLLERAFYQNQIQKIENDIAAVESQLEGASFDELLEEHQPVSYTHLAMARTTMLSTRTKLPNT